MKHLWLIGSLFCIILVAGFTTSQAQIQQDVLILHSPKVFSYSNQSQWRELVKQMKSTSKRNIIIYWSGYGGNINVGLEFIDGMQETQKQGKRVILDIVEYSASMHAIVACFASNVERESSGVLMFHLRSNWNGSGIDRSEESKQELSDLMQGCVYKKIVTQNDIRVVQSVKELRVYPNGRKVISSDRRDSR